MRKRDFTTAKVILSGDVADDGTFTVGYPTEDGAAFNAGDFENAGGHYLSLNGRKLLMGRDITLSFGASSVTVTNVTGGTLAAGSQGYFHFDLVSRGAGEQATAGVSKQVIVNARKRDTILIDWGSPKTLDADGLWDGVTATDSAKSYTIADMKAATANGGVFDVPRNATITGSSGADHVCTITGEDEYENTMVESITANSTNTVQGVKAFKKVISMTIAAGAASKTVDVGWGDYLGLPVYIGNAQNIVVEKEDGVVVGGCPQGLYDFYASHDVADLSTGSAAAPEFVAPFAFTIKKLRTTVRAAISTGGAVTMDVRGGTAVNGLSITVANSATKGTSATDTPTAGHASTLVAKGDRVQIVAADDFNGGGSLDHVLTVLPTGLRSGTFTAGLSHNTEPSATTADPRGTYLPATASDGATSFQLEVQVPDMRDLGGAQYAG